MRKQEQAFALFNQGKTTDSPEVLALGLKRATERKYYRRWLITQKPTEVKVQGVPVCYLSVGQEFRFEGNLYRIRQNRTCALLEWAPAAKCHIEKHSRYLSPDTLVQAT